MLTPPRNHLLLAAGMLSTYPGMQLVENFLKTHAEAAKEEVYPLLRVKRAKPKVKAKPKKKTPEKPKKTAVKAKTAKQKAKRSR